MATIGGMGSGGLGGLPSPPGAPHALQQSQAQHQYIRAGPPATRGFGDRISFDTGVCYVSGVLGGGLYGFGAGVLKVRAQPPESLNRTLILNQMLNSMGKNGSQTANQFAVFALTYSLSRDALKYWYRGGLDDPSNEAFGAGVAGTLQGIARFPSKIHGLGCGLAVAGVTYVGMKYGMDTIKKYLPFDKL